MASRKGFLTEVGSEAEPNSQENPPYSMDFVDLNCVPRAQEKFASRNISVALRDSKTDCIAIITNQASLGPRRGEWTPAEKRWRIQMPMSQ